MRYIARKIIASVMVLLIVGANANCVCAAVSSKLQTAARVHSDHTCCSGRNTAGQAPDSKTSDKDQCPACDRLVIAQPPEHQTIPQLQLALFTSAHIDLEMLALAPIALQAAFDSQAFWQSAPTLLNLGCALNT